MVSRLLEGVDIAHRDHGSVTTSQYEKVFLKILATPGLKGRGGSSPLPLATLSLRIAHAPALFSALGCWWEHALRPSGINSTLLPSTYSICHWILCTQTIDRPGPNRRCLLKALGLANVLPKPLHWAKLPYCSSTIIRPPAGGNKHSSWKQTKG